jgi:poly-gamma-glutamate synthesis protein (capsule biosynthesis protein)
MRLSVGVIAFVLIPVTLPGTALADEAPQAVHVGVDDANATSLGVVSPVDPVTLAFTGDTLIHMTVSAAAARSGLPYDFGPMFDGVRHLIGRADLAICHLEVPLDPKSAGLSGFPLFNAPREVAEGLAYAGYDGCSTASNHSYDQGVSGVVGTLDVLEQAGLRTAGMARTFDEGWGAAMFELDGLTVGVVSGTYWLNGLRMPSDQPWLVQLLDPAQMTVAAARAKAQGADLVVAAMHCCTEYQTQPTESQKEIAHSLIESPYIDLVVTHHSHVVGPVEEVNGEFIFHGLGNFISGQVHRIPTQDGVIGMARAVERQGEWTFEKVEVVPTRVVRYSYEVIPAEVGSASYRRTMSAINSMGAGIGVYRLPGMTLEQLALIE